MRQLRQSIHRRRLEPTTMYFPQKIELQVILENATRKSNICPIRDVRALVSVPNNVFCLVQIIRWVAA